MPLFECSKCGAADNTAVGNFWSFHMDKQPPLCSECDPEIGKWHGLFEKQPAKDVRAHEAKVSPDAGWVTWTGSEFQFERADGRPKMNNATPNDTDIRSALARIALASEEGRPLIEETLSPVEVHTSFGQEYVCLPRHIWIETCQRALSNQIRADRLQDEINGLRLQINAHEVVGAAKDREADDLDAKIAALEQRVTKAAAKMAVLRADRDKWRAVALAAIGSATIAGTMACVLAAKIAGLW